MKSMLVYGRFTTTSCIFIHALKRLLASRENQLRFVHIHLVLDDRRDVAMAREVLPADRVTLWSQYVDLHPFQCDRHWPASLMERWEEQYGYPHLRAFIHEDRALEGRSEAVRWHYLFSHIEYFEMLYNKIKPDLYVSGPADALSPWVAMTVFRKNGVRCANLSPGRFGYRSFVLHDPFESLNVGALYKDKIHRGLSAEEIQIARSFRNQYIRASSVPVTELAVRARKRRKFPSPLSALRLIREAYSDSGNADLPLRKALERAARARLTGVRNALLRRQTVSRLPEDEKYFFFPLQYEPEASASIQARGWSNQLEVIRLISHSLPIDRWLYVKEHPSMSSGVRPRGFYRRILALPRVRLLRQDMDSHEIIRRAKATITVTGTAAWEGLMFGHPAVVFGHAFYEEFTEGVIKLDRPEELPLILRSLREWAIPEEPLLAYITAVLARSPEGIFIEPRLFPAVASTVLGNPNLDHIGSVILKEFESAVGA